VTEPQVRGRSRAFAPGSGRVRLLVAGAIILAAVGASFGWRLTRGGDQASAAARYGQLPGWLPKAKVSTGRVLQASSQHPRLAIQGDTLSVHLRGGAVLATAVGPAVPEDGQFPVPPTSPCTFTVTFRSATGAIPVRAGSFTILDELGHVHHPHVTTMAGGALPTRVGQGQTLALRVADVLPTGGGRLRWTPEGGKPIASWDFDVEID
jgi:hypothetical protein